MPVPPAPPTPFRQAALPRRGLLSVLLAAFLLLAARDGYSQAGSWQPLLEAPVAQGLRARHDDVFFLNPSTGWVVNPRGEIWKTTDGGATWTEQLDTAGAVGFRSVVFVSEQVGWAGTILTPDDVLYETRDGGETWANVTNRIQGSRPAGVCGLWAVNEQVVYGAGVFFGEPHLIKTDDGGETWTSTNLSALVATLIDVYFFNEDEGIIVGGTGTDFDGEAVILRTTDGGATWEQVHTTTRAAGVGGEWAWKISFPTPEVGYVSVEYVSNINDQPAKVLKTTDGGLTWTALSVIGSTDMAGLQGVGFITEDVGWASGRGTTSLTLDGGATWQQLAPYSEQQPEGQLDGRVNRVFVLNDTLAYAVGQRVYQYTLGSVSTRTIEAPALPRAFSLDQNYPNPFNPSTRIGYTLHRAVDVRITVYDLWGREVRTLVNARQGPGRYEATWDGRNAAGRRVASGAYLYLIDVGEALEMKRMVLLK